MRIPAGYAQVNVFWTSPNLPRGAQTVYGIFNDIDGTAEEVGDLVATAWAASLSVADFPINVTLDAYLVKLGPNSTGQSALRDTIITGSNAAVADIPQSSVLVTKNTAVGGRKGKGRMYLPFGAGTLIDVGGGLNSTFVSNLQGDMNDLRAAHAAAAIPMVLLHNDPGDTPNLITSLTVQSLSATQRRRLR